MIGQTGHWALKNKKALVFFFFTFAFYLLTSSFLSLRVRASVSPREAKATSSSSPHARRSTINDKSGKYTHQFVQPEHFCF
ncbi:hypothetical protein VF04_37145 [Nostoc linckia z7]|jgi:hypothetical protein|uniref:Uncharacterized protein n=2 Tax=Nostoc linckia TaxID=92942 RepID=A0A9Q5Z5L8_NOSLI|nr:hypothetical protein VF02_25630 [Nostoc linckia z1]PHJ60315.1 hypothetical protein VF03_33525 [Nostoc linckia z2]PHJ63133.1 hypothetical protein VF05_25015 [Nostoc linckia z3]PHJ80734.1 hypothetical protein VF06_21350 [Nostoc linckia z4]PHJ82620.1 hypothetical protein VF04_37145 [Nostoc linckia z7]PHJ90828.1 hypothetical protein VF07_07950 [Nostoc linckia z6]PHJ94705.1 hypothetical protein VF08_33265 [Nostoc linckia z8]PHJ99240.1 hypothetical protein VF09_34605 [Nostoc linckia z9]PHK1719